MRIHRLPGSYKMSKVLSITKASDGGLDFNMACGHVLHSIYSFSLMTPEQRAYKTGRMMVCEPCGEPPQQRDDTEA